MLELTYQEIWEKICDQIRSYQEVNGSQANAFFPRLTLQVISEDFAIITADSAFIKSYVEKHFLQYFQRALFDLTQREYTIVIEEDVPSSKPVIVQAANQPNQTAASAVSQNTQAAATTMPTAQNTVHSTAAKSATPLPEETQQAKSQADITSSAKAQAAGDAPAAPARKKKNPLTSSYTFENYVIGESNKMAYSMALAVAEAPGRPHLNPLFIYGKSGLGKTHLLRAIQNYIDDTNESDSQNNLVAVYVDSTEFLNDYTDASIEHSKEKASFKRFKEKYETADILLLDDIQVLRDKPQTLEIVFEIFKKFIDTGKQIVLAADRAPKNIDIDERYQSRFNSGATFDIQPPEIETKLGIIKRFVETTRNTEEAFKDVEIPRDVQVYIAENSGSNIRELKSAITRIFTATSVYNEGSIDVRRAAALLEDHFSGGITKRLEIIDIQRQVEAFYGVEHEDLIGKKRTKNISYARQICMYLCREMLDYSLKTIGEEFGREHPTVKYSVDTIENKVKDDPETADEIALIKKRIREE